MKANRELFFDFKDNEDLKISFSVVIPKAEAIKIRDAINVWLDRKKESKKMSKKERMSP